MEKQRFLDFWNECNAKWLNDAICYPMGNRESVCKVDSLCGIRKNAGSKIYSNYMAIKDVAKQCYFSNNEPVGHLLNKYKRAAVLSYATLLSDCIVYNDSALSDFDPYFLKERLAFALGLFSIVQSICSAKGIDPNTLGQIFDFNSIGNDRGPSDDTFLENVYKDYYFSIKYNNFNILTTANLFEMIVEHTSNLLKL